MEMFGVGNRCVLALGPPAISVGAIPDSTLTPRFHVGRMLQIELRFAAGCLVVGEIIDLAARVQPSTPGPRRLAHAQLRWA
jgi:hypothetical protein